MCEEARKNKRGVVISFSFSQNLCTLEHGVYPGWDMRWWKDDAGRTASYCGTANENKEVEPTCSAWQARAD